MAAPEGRDELLCERADGVLRVVVNRPEKRNALSRTLLADLRAAFLAASEDETLRLAILTGAGDKSFAAGGDLRDLSSVRTEEEARQMSLDARAALDAIRDFPVPVIAGLNGDALGGGAELAAACDFRVAAGHARIGFVQGRLGVSTAWGGGIDLINILGPTKALRLLATARVLDAREAMETGFVDAVAGEGEHEGCDLDAATQAFAAPMLKQAPQVLRAFKALSVAARRGEGRAGLEAIENARFARTWIHDDHWAAADAVLKGSRHR
ncbi:MAG: enoyl-CoA hydratase/isomerase family protein [Salinarimonadaceae bacterium]|nr:MAG: enoyl-CoA hydratase/isomerase family protein [Salinarimonadaceae bacterium]